MVFVIKVTNSNFRYFSMDDLAIGKNVTLIIVDRKPKESELDEIISFATGYFGAVSIDTIKRLLKEKGYKIIPYESIGIEDTDYV